MTLIFAHENVLYADSSHLLNNQDRRYEASRQKITRSKHGWGLLAATGYSIDCYNLGLWFEDAFEPWLVGHRADLPYIDPDASFVGVVVSAEGTFVLDQRLRPMPVRTPYWVGADNAGAFVWGMIEAGVAPLAAMEKAGERFISILGPYYSERP